MSVEESNSIGDDFSIIISGLSSLGVVDVFIIAPSGLVILLDCLVIDSSLLIGLLLSSHVDSSGQDINGVIELSNLSLFLIDSLLDGILGILVLFDPVRVGSSLKFS